MGRVGSLVWLWCREKNVLFLGGAQSQGTSIQYSDSSMFPFQMYVLGDNDPGTIFIIKDNGMYEQLGNNYSTINQITNKNYCIFALYSDLLLLATSLTLEIALSLLYICVFLVYLPYIVSFYLIWSYSISFYSFCLWAAILSESPYGDQ